MYCAILKSDVSKILCLQWRVIIEKAVYSLFREL